MQRGQVRCERLLTHRYPLDAYRQAFATAVDKQKCRSVKVAFDLAGESADG
jgi:threonine dehydrogenase-like Zn-dependent dehydrogenase